MLGRCPAGVACLTLAPVSAARYRCAACGNVTRFDVTVTRTTTAFHHFTVGGDLTVEDEQLVAENVERVSCRWCGTGSAVDTVSE